MEASDRVIYRGLKCESRAGKQQSLTCVRFLSSVLEQQSASLLGLKLEQATVPVLHFQAGRGDHSRGKGGWTGQARAFRRPGDGWGRRERKWEVRGVRDG